tara:strand:- start:8028 stop:9980 length:1953 start_codon:yes stop_codon:yes gene_type:complete
MSNELKVKIIGDASKLTASLNKASSKLSAFGKSARKVGKDLSLKLTLPIALAGGAAIKLASDFEESLNKVDVAFGKSSAEVKSFAKTTLTQFGIAEGSALDMAALFGDMATSMGITRNEASLMSTSMVGLAGDLASFKNIGIEQATTALAGVFTGETESLKRLGIVMTEINLKQFAMSQGIQKNIKDMTQAEKVSLRYQFILSKTGNAQGDFAKTQGGAANQMRIFTEGLKQLGQSIGSIMLPAFTKIVAFTNKIIEKFIALDDTTKKIIIVVGLVVSAIGPFIFILGSVSTILSIVTTKFTILNTAMNANPFILVGTAVVGLVAIFVTFVQKLEPAVSKWQTFVNIIKSFGSPGKFAALQLKTKAENAKEAAAQAEKDKKATDKLTKANNELLKSLQNINSQSGTKGNVQRQTVGQVNQIAPGAAGLSETAMDPITQMAMGAKNGNAIMAEELAKSNEMLQSNIEQRKSKIEQFKQIGLAMGESMQNTFATMGNSIAQSLGMGESALGTFAGTLVQTAMTSIGSSLATTMGFGAEAAAGTAKSLGPIGAFVLPALLAGAAVAVKGAFSKVQAPQKFANGGIVSAPTMGLVGEYAGAKSNPEVIAPLDKLKGMIGEKGQQKVDVGGSFTLKGQDLVVALQRANTNRNRVL